MVREHRVLSEKHPNNACTTEENIPSHQVGELCKLIAVFLEHQSPDVMGPPWAFLHCLRYALQYRRMFCAVLAARAIYNLVEVLRYSAHTAPHPFAVAFRRVLDQLKCLRCKAIVFLSCVRN
jgi:hypothetical protein